VIRRYCDSCGEEIDRDAVTNRIKKRWSPRHRPSILVEVTAGTNGVWNEGDLCVVCVMQALDLGENLQ